MLNKKIISLVNEGASLRTTNKQFFLPVSLRNIVYSYVLKIVPESMIGYSQNDWDLVINHFATLVFNESIKKTTLVSGQLPSPIPAPFSSELLSPKQLNELGLLGLPTSFEAPATKRPVPPTSRGNDANPSTPPPLVGKVILVEKQGGVNLTLTTVQEEGEGLEEFVLLSKEAPQKQHCLIVGYGRDNKVCFVAEISFKSPLENRKENPATFLLQVSSGESEEESNSEDHTPKKNEGPQNQNSLSPS